MYKLTAIVLTILFAKCALAQAAPPGTSTFGQDTQTAVSSYFQFIKEEAEIYNGVEHPPYDFKLIGIAYYKVDEWQNASIEYNGILYKEIRAKYDLVRDQLVIRHSSGMGLGLYSPRVSWFSLGNDHFIYKQKGEGKTVPATGFYKLLRTGALSAFVKYSRSIQEKIEGQELKKQVEAVDRYYIVKDSVYHDIRNKAALLALMGDHKSEVKKSLRKAGIRFKKAPEQALVTAVDIYNNQK